jgi:hypothetical protein
VAHNLQRFQVAQVYIKVLLVFMEEEEVDEAKYYF